MTPAYLLTPAAEQDLREIALASYERFGLKQALATHEQIERLLSELGENPGLGHRRDDLSPAGRSLRYQTVLKRFLIVYQPDVEPIRVIALLDGARDVAALLSERL